MEPYGEQSGSVREIAEILVSLVWGLGRSFFPGASNVYLCPIYHFLGTMF